MASVGLASKLHDHQQQMTILDQSKTLAESALQMLYAAKEGGGNPKVLIIQGAFPASSVVCFFKLQFVRYFTSYDTNIELNNLSTSLQKLIFN